MARLCLVFLVASIVLVEGISIDIPQKDIPRSKTDKLTIAVENDRTVLKPLDPDVCLEPPEVGPCKSNLQRFYYDINTGQCRGFIYGGCEGNKNNFQNRNDCQLKCDPRQDKEESARVDCNQDGLFKKRNDCGSFIHCSNGQAYIKRCPGGLHFSEKLIRCEYPCIAQCDPRIRCETTDTKPDLINTTRVDCSTDGQFAHSDDCSRFIECSNGRSHTMLCPSGLHFSNRVKRCVPPCEARCNLDIPCIMDGNRCENGKCFECPFPDGKFSDSYDCSIYHECRDNFASLRSCRPGKYFDERRKKCVKEERANCVYVCAEPDGIYQYPHNCESYIKCTRGKPKVKRCSQGKTFDKEFKRCVRYGKTRCRQNSIMNILHGAWEE